MTPGMWLRKDERPTVSHLPHLTLGAGGAGLDADGRLILETHDADLHLHSSRRPRRAWLLTGRRFCLQ